ncbi:hypothetical protein [Paenibacillus wenxiniae]|uniref:Uncharacterized protein n=1 Tax=Paenibacillus wenxiniae TaxID=1636843 RepID=A0ABW4RJR9_9BACL
MKAVPLVDEQGYFIEDVLVDVSFIGTSVLEGKGTIISQFVPSGLYKPHWNFDKSIWTEGMSAEDIAALHPVVTETSEQKISRLEQSDLDNKELIASLYEMMLAQGGH